MISSTIFKKEGSREGRKEGKEKLKMKNKSENEIKVTGSTIVSLLTSATFPFVGEVPLPMIMCTHIRCRRTNLLFYIKIM